MEVDASNLVFSTYSSIYETAVIYAIIILLTYDFDLFRVVLHLFQRKENHT